MIFLVNFFYVKRRKNFHTIILLYRYPLYINKKNLYGYNSKNKILKKFLRIKMMIIRISKKCKNSLILNKLMMKNNSYNRVKKYVVFMFLLFLVIRVNLNHFRKITLISKDLWEVDWKFQVNLIINIFC